MCLFLVNSSCLCTLFTHQTYTGAHLTLHPYLIVILLILRSGGRDLVKLDDMRHVQILPNISHIISHVRSNVEGGKLFPDAEFKILFFGDGNFNFPKHIVSFSQVNLLCCL